MSSGKSDQLNGGGAPTDTRRREIEMEGWEGGNERHERETKCTARIDQQQEGVVVVVWLAVLCVRPLMMFSCWLLG